MKGCLHSFCLIAFCSPEIYIKFKEGKSPSHDPLPDKVDVLVSGDTEKELRSGLHGDSAARVPWYKAEFYYLTTYVILGKKLYHCEFFVHKIVVIKLHCSKC